MKVGARGRRLDTLFGCYSRIISWLSDSPPQDFLTRYCWLPLTFVDDFLNLLVTLLTLLATFWLSLMSFGLSRRLPDFRWWLLESPDDFSTPLVTSWYFWLLPDSPWWLFNSPDSSCWLSDWRLPDSPDFSWWLPNYLELISFVNFKFKEIKIHLFWHKI